MCGKASFLIKLTLKICYFIKKECFLVNFAKYVRTPFLKNFTRRLLLIIEVSIVVKGKLAYETVNYDTKTKA